VIRVGIKATIVGVIFSLVACGVPNAESEKKNAFDKRNYSINDVINVDDRYSLALYGMPSVSFSDAKSCYQIAGIGKEELLSTPGVVGEIFGVHMQPYWQHLVRIGASSEASPQSILLSGKYVNSDDSPDFTVSGTLVERGELCGEITGRVFVASGFVNLEQILEMEASTDDASFDSQQATGMYILINAASELGIQNSNLILSCVSSLRIEITKGKDVTPDYLVWVSLLGDKISSGALDPMTLDNNADFKSLIDAGGDFELAEQGIDREKLEMCTSISSNAIEMASKEMQQ